MAKSGGIADLLFVDGYDLSGDLGSVQNIRGGPSLLDVTAINKSAMERIAGPRDGGLNFAGFFNDNGAANRAAAAGSTFEKLTNFPATDRNIAYFRGQTIGNAAAGLVGKQVNIPWSRGQDGSLTFDVEALCNAFGLEWGQMLTAGKRTDGSATNGASLDDLGGAPASTAFGLSAQLHVFAFTGTSVTVAIQDSADNAAFANITGAVFTAATGITSERIQTGAAQTIRRYLRVATTGTFSNAVFAVMFSRHMVATL